MVYLLLQAIQSSFQGNDKLDRRRRQMMTPVLSRHSKSISIVSLSPPRRALGAALGLLWGSPATPAAHSTSVHTCVGILVIPAGSACLCELLWVLPQRHLLTLNSTLSMIRCHASSQGSHTGSAVQAIAGLLRTLSSAPVLVLVSSVCERIDWLELSRLP